MYWAVWRTGGTSDSVFHVVADELVIPIKGDVDFDIVANGFEALAGAMTGASFDEDQDAQMASLTLESGATITVMNAESELIVTVADSDGFLDLVRQSATTLRQFDQHEVAGHLW